MSQAITRYFERSLNCTTQLDVVQKRTLCDLKRWAPPNYQKFWETLPSEVIQKHSLVTWSKTSCKVWHTKQQLDVLRRVSIPPLLQYVVQHGISWKLEEKCSWKAQNKHQRFGNDTRYVASGAGAHLGDDGDAFITHGLKSRPLVLGHSNPINFVK